MSVSDALAALRKKRKKPSECFDEVERKASPAWAGGEGGRSWVWTIGMTSLYHRPLSPTPPPPPPHFPTFFSSLLPSFHLPSSPLTSPLLHLPLFPLFARSQSSQKATTSHTFQFLGVRIGRRWAYTPKWSSQKVHYCVFCSVSYCLSWNYSIERSLKHSISAIWIAKTNFPVSESSQKW